jgi:hypothetical protein
MKLDARELQLQINNLYLEYPELKDDDILRLNTLEGQTDIMEFFTAAIKAMDEEEFLLTGLDKRLEELTVRYQRTERRVEALRTLMLKIMRSADLKKLVLPVATLSQRSGQPKLIGEPDVALLPEELVRVTRSPDKVKIKEALLRGDFVPECTLSNAEPILAILTK